MPAGLHHVHKAISYEKGGMPLMAMNKLCNKNAISVALVSVQKGSEHPGQSFPQYHPIEQA